MAFAGIPNAKDRADLISYLKTKVAEWWWSPRCLSAKKSAVRELSTFGSSSECYGNGASLSDAPGLPPIRESLSGTSDISLSNNLFNTIYSESKDGG